MSEAMDWFHRQVVDADDDSIPDVVGDLQDLVGLDPAEDIEYSTGRITGLRKSGLNKVRDRIQKLEARVEELETCAGD